MKVEYGSVRITAVPGIEAPITVYRDGGDGKPNIAIKLSARKSLNFGLNEFAGFVSAVTYALNQAEEMADAAKPPAPADGSPAIEPDRPSADQDDSE